MQRLLGYLTLFALFAPIACSARDFPRGCESVGHQFSQQDLILKPKVADDAKSPQTLYMLKNTSRQTIIVRNHVNKEMIVAPVWEATIYRNRWAAFATNKAITKFQCQSQSRTKKKIAVNCEEVLDVCQYPRAKFSISNFGTYWVTSNQSLSGAIRQASRKGILLRW